MRQALAFAISQVFTIALGLILIGFIANFFIKEIPLRRQHGFAGHTNQGE
jgi:hypothetical protein